MDDGTIATGAIALLDMCSLDSVRELDDAKLRRFEALCYHWQQLADAELRKRIDRKPESTSRTD